MPLSKQQTIRISGTLYTKDHPDIGHSLYTADNPDSGHSLYTADYPDSGHWPLSLPASLIFLESSLIGTDFGLSFHVKRGRQKEVYVCVCVGGGGWVWVCVCVCVL